jgi:hypothetical protein
LYTNTIYSIQIWYIALYHAYLALYNTPLYIYG